MDFASYFTDTAALAVAVVAIVAFAKEHIVTGLHGAYTIVLSVLTGAALGAGGVLFGFLEGTIAFGLTFGVAAGFLAAGGWDAVRALLGKR